MRLISDWVTSCAVAFVERRRLQRLLDRALASGRPFSQGLLPELYFWRNLWIHQRGTAVGVNHLSGNPASLL